jgi:hypothetical protein
MSTKEPRDDAQWDPTQKREKISKRRVLFFSKFLFWYFPPNQFITSSFRFLVSITSFFFFSNLNQNKGESGLYRRCRAPCCGFVCVCRTSISDRKIRKETQQTMELCAASRALTTTTATTMSKKGEKMYHNGTG